MSHQAYRPVQPVAAVCADTLRVDVFHASHFKESLDVCSGTHSPLSSFLLLLWLQLVYGL